MVFKRNFSTGGAAVEIVDALDSTATDKALSAAQGKVLNDGKADTTHNHDADYASKASEHTHSNKAALDKISDAGDGSKMLADDGTYVTPSGGGGFVQDPTTKAIKVAIEAGATGNARGINAGDGQAFANYPGDVASGNYSGIGFGGYGKSASGVYSGVGNGGWGNTASEYYAGVGNGGRGNTASGRYADVGNGSCNALAAMYGESAHGADRFATQGDAQRGHLMFRGAPGSGDTDVEIFLYGASNSRFVLQNYDAYLCEVSFIGNSNAAGITYFAGQRRFLASRQGSAATTAITGLETIGTDIGSSGAISFVANTSDGSIRCMVNSGTASVAYDFLVDIKYTKVRNA